MLISTEYNLKSQSKNLVHIVSGLSKLKDLNLSKKQQTYFETKLKDGAFASINDCGTYTIVVKFDKIKDNGNKEAIRKSGSSVFNLLKGEVESVQVESASAEAIELLSEGLGLSSYVFDKYRKDKNDKKAKLSQAFTTNKKAKLESVNTIVDATCWARDMVNEPLSHLTANQLAEEIKEKCKNTGIEVEVFGKQKIESLKMGGLLAVNKGSIDPPAFISMEWKPKNAKNKKPIVLVGKGIVYDTGGVSLKPTANSMDFMKSDMGGAAAMAGTIIASANLKTPLHIITLIPATDNRPGGNAYVPGDIITMFDGTTVEVLNTDAEGRMVLADAIAYSNKFKPELIIDAATLTGAAAAAIGPHASIAMGNAKQEILDDLNEAGLATHDRIVQFPFWSEYYEDMKSPIADLKNLGGKYAGMITAGKFLEHFAKHPYIHIDIAGPAYTHARKDYWERGGTGAGVRLLTEFLKRKAK